MAYFECLHELKLIVDLMNEAGISGMRFSVSETAKWGDVSVGPKIIDASVKKRMKAALKDIQSGKFAKGWINEYNGGYKKYNALLKAGENHPIEKVGQRLRALDALDEETLRQRRPGGLLMVRAAAKTKRLKGKIRRREANYDDLPGCKCAHASSSLGRFSHSCWLGRRAARPSEVLALWKTSDLPIKG